MLTAHQRILISRHLPEVMDVWVREDLNILALSLIRLNLREGGQVVVTTRGDGTRLVRRYRLVGDYSDRPLLVAIEPEMRQRLVRVFGQLNFGGDDA
jgi:hypothetical protein